MKQQTDPKPGRFYSLPKVHKHGNPGRPIVWQLSPDGTYLRICWLPSQTVIVHKRHYTLAQRTRTSTVDTEHDSYYEQLYLQRRTLTSDTRYSHGNQNGTSLCHAYANLFLAKSEADALSRAPYQPHTWRRYIDDTFMLWTHSVDDLHAFTSYLNSIYLTIKFTSNYSLIYIYTFSWC